jgi:hypothetical protein
MKEKCVHNSQCENTFLLFSLRADIRAEILLPVFYVTVCLGSKFNVTRMNSSLCAALKVE